MAQAARNTTQPTQAVAAARARLMTGSEKLARSIEIAERDHLMFRSRYHGANELGEAVFSVPSRAQPGRVHVVRLAAAGVWLCGCTAAEHGLPCGHVGAAARHWAQIYQAMTEAGQRANAQYVSFGEWLEARGY
jgi:hypothetical protein